MNNYKSMVILLLMIYKLNLMVVRCIDYIGSKRRLNQWMFSKINQKFENPFDTVFLDGCAGIGEVSIYACNQGYKVISNDLMQFSSHIIRGMSCIDKEKFKQAKKHIKQINDLPGHAGFFYENYSASAGRMYFTDYNAQKIDACRGYINSLDDECLKNYLLYCGLEALSRVQNTTGVQAAFLKKFKKSAKRKYVLDVEWTSYAPNLIGVYTKDINDLLVDSNVGEDIIYIDPPYNERQYGPNYHLYETFVKYDEPIIKGKTGLRDWSYTRSDFCQKQNFFKFLKSIINRTHANYMYFNYNSDGFFTSDELLSFFNDNCISTTLYREKQIRFRSDTKPNRKYNTKSLEEWFFEISIK